MHKKQLRFTNFELLERYEMLKHTLSLTIIHLAQFSGFLRVEKLTDKNKKQDGQYFETSLNIKKIYNFY